MNLGGGLPLLVASSLHCWDPIAIGCLYDWLVEWFLDGIGKNVRAFFGCGRDSQRGFDGIHKDVRAIVNCRHNSPSFLGDIDEARS